MSTPSSRRPSRLELLAIVLTVLGVLVTILASNLSQVSDNLAGLRKVVVPLYVVMATGGLIVLLVMRHRTNQGSIAEGSIVVARHRSDPVRVDPLREALHRAKRIDVVGIANNALTSDSSIEFYKQFLLTRKGRARLLFLDPDSDAIHEREAAESRQPGTLSLFVQHNLEDVVRFLTQCAEDNPTVVSRVEVRLYKATPALNAIVVDDDVAFVHYYGSHSRGYDVPTFVISRQGASEVFDFYRHEFDSLWDAATPWRELRIDVPKPAPESLED